MSLSICVELRARWPPPPRHHSACRPATNYQIWMHTHIHHGSSLSPCMYDDVCQHIGTRRLLFSFKLLERRATERERMLLHPSVNALFYLMSPQHTADSLVPACTPTADVHNAHWIGLFYRSLLTKLPSCCTFLVFTSAAILIYDSIETWSSICNPAIHA